MAVQTTEIAVLQRAGRAGGGGVANAQAPAVLEADGEAVPPLEGPSGPRSGMQGPSGPRSDRRPGRVAVAEQPVDACDPVDDEPPAHPEPQLQHRPVIG